MTYQEECNQILNDSIENIFFKTWKNGPPIRPSEQQLLFECYITPECNQTCSYCYLCKHGDELYPPELRDPDRIIKNYEMLLNYLIENNLNPYRFDIFSGEIWDTQLGYDILSTTLKALDNGFNPDHIVIPSNYSFLLNEEKTQKIDDFIAEFEKRNKILAFSCSNDGLYCDTLSRPLNEPDNFQLQKGTPEYYEKLFEWNRKHTHKFGFHPMVSAHSIKHWKENFYWWMENLIKYDYNVFKYLMLLEVRNDDWTDESIEDYLNYLNASIDWLYDYGFGRKNTNKSHKELYIDWLHNGLQDLSNNYQPTIIREKSMDPGCTIHRAFVVRLGDLAIVPCHRTSYNEYIFGKFQVENDKIIGIGEAKNIQFMNQVWFNNMIGVAKCNNCLFKNKCIKGCYGSQIEATGDPLYPCETVCELLQAKFIFLYYKYKKMDVFDERDQKFLFNIEEIKKTEVHNKWYPVIMNLIIN